MLRLNEIIICESRAIGMLGDLSAIELVIPTWQDESPNFILDPMVD